MTRFVIIEVDDGLTIATVETGQTPEEVAARDHGVVVDDELYETYEEAADALAELEATDEEASGGPR